MMSINNKTYFKNRNEIVKLLYTDLNTYEFNNFNYNINNLYFSAFFVKIQFCLIAANSVTSSSRNI